TGAYKPERDPSLPRSILGVLATMLLAIGLTVGGLAPRLMRSYGWGDGAGGTKPRGLIETARAFVREILYGEHPGQAGLAAGAPPRLPIAPNQPRAGGSTTGLGEGGFPGVILWPERQP